MRVTFRVDASNIIGSGHIMRCLNLARALNIECHFICRDLEGNLINLIKDQGFRVHTLPAVETTPTQECDDRQWLFVDPTQDAAQTNAILQQVESNILITDHYGIDEDWETQIKNNNPELKLVTIDDTANRKHKTDFIIDHNLYCDFETRYNELTPDKCIKLLGPKYAMIQPKLQNIRQWRQENVSESMKNIFVYFGGADLHGSTYNILAKLKTYNINLHALINNNNPKYGEIMILARDSQNVKVAQNSDAFFNLLRISDLAIGAGGVSSIERCYIGLPSLNISIAQNQKKLCSDQAKNGASIYLGHYDEITTKTLTTSLNDIASHPNKLTKLVQTGKEIFDGKGLPRLAREILK